ncbi:MAG: helix-turn-helix transcriptional regulator [Limimaricola soesokkakensis]|uniref:helix-turn-helix transcriptional regulator n=1 Tax=Limimaricola soesokkakensis TaxID=1343159 RepID=UPI004059D274
MPPLPHNAAIAGLLDEIYHSVISPERWGTLPERLAATVGGGAWALQLVRPGQPRRADLHGCNFDPKLVALYPDRYAALNPWLASLLQRPALQLTHDHHVIQRKGFFRSEFYTEFLRPQGDIHRTFGTIITRGDSGSLVVSCNYAPSEAEAVGVTGSQLLATLAPHLRRAFDLTRMAGHSTLQAGTRLIDGLGLPHACYAIDSRGRLVACDSRGAALLERGDALRLGDERRLRFADAEANAALDDRLVQEGRVGGSFVVDDRAPQRMLARLSHLPRPLATSPIESLFRGERAIAVLTVIEPGAPGALDEDLTKLFELTPAETLVLRRLCEGLSMAEIAAMREVSVNTVRNQIRSLFEKTGTRRQAELVALVARLGG